MHVDIYKVNISSPPSSFFHTRLFFEIIINENVVIVFIRFP